MGTGVERFGLVALGRLKMGWGGVERGVGLFSREVVSVVRVGLRLGLVSLGVCQYLGKVVEAVFWRRFWMVVDGEMEGFRV